MSKPNNTTKEEYLRQKVRLPKRTLDAFKAYKAYGDFTTIKARIKDKSISTVKIGRALKSGLCDPKIVHDIVDYYDEVAMLHAAFKN